MRIFASTLIWYHTKNQRHIANTEAKRLTLPIYINITCYVFTGTVFITLDKWIKNYLTSSTMSLLFKNYSLEEVTYLLIRFNEIKFFPRNTKNTDKNGANKQNTHMHTKHSGIYNTGKSKLVWMKISSNSCFKTSPIFFQHFPFYEKNLNHPPFLGKLRRVKYLFVKVGGEEFPTMRGTTLFWSVIQGRPSIRLYQY